jgi:hypothetical protein
MSYNLLDEIKSLKKIQSKNRFWKKKSIDSKYVIIPIGKLCHNGCKNLANTYVLTIVDTYRNSYVGV